MYHSIHTDFIQTPIEEILREGINACRTIGTGIEIHPLREYVFSSLFLRMTGAQEQKLKCIHWELATHELEIRLDLLKKVNNFGEYSTYKSKNDLYTILFKLIQNQKGAAPFSSTDKTELIDSIVSGKENSFINMLRVTGLHLWAERDFHLLEQSIYNKINKEKLQLNERYFFDDILKNDYQDIVYQHRNRCAHNLTSYQRHLPDLKTLASNGYEWHNYLYRFALLVLIDRIFIQMHAEYIELLS